MLQIKAYMYMQYNYLFLFSGFQVAADKFFIFFVTLFLTTLAASSVAFLFSALFRVTGIATLFVAMSFVIQMVSYVSCRCIPPILVEVFFFM